MQFDCYFLKLFQNTFLADSTGVTKYSCCSLFIKNIIRDNNQQIVAIAFGHCRTNLKQAFLIF